MVLTIII